MNIIKFSILTLILACGGSALPESSIPKASGGSSNLTDKVHSLPVEEVKYEVEFHLGVQTEKGIVEYPNVIEIPVESPVGMNWSCRVRPQQIVENSLTMASGFVCTNNDNEDLVGIMSICYMDKEDSESRAIMLLSDNGSVFMQLFSTCKTSIRK